MYHKQKSLAIALSVTPLKERFHIDCRNVGSILEQIADGSIDDDLALVEKINIKECGPQLIPRAVDESDDIQVARLSQMMRFLPCRLTNLKIVNVERLMTADQKLTTSETSLNSFIQEIDCSSTVVRVRLDIDGHGGEGRKHFPTHDEAVFDSLVSVKLSASKSRDLMSLFPTHLEFPGGLERFEFLDTHDEPISFDPLARCPRLERVSLTKNYVSLDWLPENVCKLSIGDQPEASAQELIQRSVRYDLDHIRVLTINVHRYETNPLRMCRFRNLETAHVCIWSEAAAECLVCLDESCDITQLSLTGVVDPISLFRKHPSLTESLKWLGLSKVAEDLLPVFPEKCRDLAKRCPLVSQIEMSFQNWNGELMTAFFSEYGQSVVILVKLGHSNAENFSKVAAEQEDWSVSSSFACQVDHGFLRLQLKSGDAVPDENRISVDLDSLKVVLTR